MANRAPIKVDAAEPARFLAPLDAAFPAEAEKAFGHPMRRVARRRPEDFAPLHCRAYLKDDMKIGRMGIVEVTLQIRWDNRDRALELLELSEYPMEMYLRPCRRD